MLFLNYFGLQETNLQRKGLFPNKIKYTLYININQYLLIEY